MLSDMENETTNALATVRALRAHTGLGLEYTRRLNLNKDNSILTIVERFRLILTDSRGFAPPTVRRANVLILHDYREQNYGYPDSHFTSSLPHTISLF